MMGKVNGYLNKSMVHTGKRCVLCGRGHPDTVLNIEGHIHHHAKMECLDRKSCNRARKKRSKRRV